MIHSVSHLCIGVVFSDEADFNIDTVTTSVWTAIFRVSLGLLWPRWSSMSTVKRSWWWSLDALQLILADNTPFLALKKRYQQNQSMKNCSSVQVLLVCAALLWLIWMSSCRRLSARNRISSWSFLPASGNASSLIVFTMLWNIPSLSDVLAVATVCCQMSLNQHHYSSSSPWCPPINIRGHVLYSQFSRTVYAFLQILHNISSTDRLQKREKMAKEHRDQRVNNFHVNPINLAGYRTSDRCSETNLLKISHSLRIT